MSKKEIEESLFNEMMGCLTDVLRQDTIRVMKTILKNRGYIKKSALEEAREYYTNWSNELDSAVTPFFNEKITELKNLYEKAIEELQGER